VDLGGAVGVAGGVAVDSLAAADGEQGALLAGFGPDVGGARVVGGVGRVSEIDHRVPGGGRFQQRDQPVGEEGRLGRRVGLAGHGRGQFIGKCDKAFGPSRCSTSVRPETE
jgi:hypothetical protein